MRTCLPVEVGRRAPRAAVLAPVPAARAARVVRGPVLIVAMLAFFAVAAAAAPAARYLGLREGRALLTLGGETLALAPGERGPGGIRIVAADPRAAWLREAGRTWVLVVGRMAVPLTGEVSLARGRDGRYRAAARLGSLDVAAEVDPRAAHVLVPARLARRARIGFDRRTGLRATVRGRDVLAFPVRLERVSIDGVTVHGVPALVVEDRRVGELILGAPYVARFDSVAGDDGALLLGLR